MNVLGVGAHYDDLELGCSGTLINHVKKGDNVTMLVITDSSYKNPDGQEESLSAGDPPFAVRTQAAARHEAMQMGMVVQGLSPGMQDGQEPQVRAKVFGVGSDAQKGFGRSGKQDAVYAAFVLQC